MRLDVVGVEVERLVVGGERLGVAVEVAEQDAASHPGVGGVRVLGDDPVDGAEGVLEAVEVVVVRRDGFERVRVEEVVGVLLVGAHEVLDAVARGVVVAVDVAVAEVERTHEGERLGGERAEESAGRAG